MRVYLWLGCTALIVGLVIGFWPDPPIADAPHPISDALPQHPAAVAPQKQLVDAHMAPKAIPAPADQDLWPESQWSQKLSEDGFPLYSTQADLSQLRNLDRGKVITLPLPNGAEPVKAHITEKKAGFGGMPVLTGGIGADPDESAESITVVLGKLDTHMTIITRQATWTAVIDNDTGKAIVVDERDRMKNQLLDINDGVEADHPPLPVPPAS